MYSKEVVVTPEMASDWLANNNGNNRPISMDRVRRWAGEMDAGRWKMDPTGISFTPQMLLLNGQHRLKAVVIHGKPVKFYVHYDVPEDVRPAMDQNLVRTAGQILATEEHTPKSNQLTAAARTILESALGRAKPSNPEIVEFARKHLELFQKYAFLAPEFTAGVHAAFVFAEMNGYKGVEEAAARLSTMKWARDGDPMRALARGLNTMGARDGAKAKSTRFFTTLNTLNYVDMGEDLLVARKHETMPARVRESVRPPAHEVAA